jgi:16S rRNA G966 N2-methylase RsmD
MVKIVESKIVPIDTIRENDWNPNSMSPNTYKFLKQSIKKRGFVQPIIVSKDGVIIDGAHRYRSLKELGATEVEVKVIDITDAECKAETINLNLTKGTFDADKLGQILLELDQEWGKELLKENLVMEQKQIDAAIRAHQSVEKLPECAPVTMEGVKSTVRNGDLYALGNHRLMCGDSTDEAALSVLVGDRKVNIVLTDPPYNVKYEYNDNMDDMPEDMYEMFIKQFVASGMAFAPFFIITPGNRNEKYYYRNFEVLGTAFWYKGFALTPGTICHAMVTEPILFIGEKPKGKRLDTDHLEYHTDREVGLRDEHSCPKPIGLFKELVTTFTNVGDSVLDLFGGSGTTLIVCELTQRTCYMMEKDPQYVQSIINRVEKQFGVKAKKIRPTELCQNCFTSPCRCKPDDMHTIS